MRVFILSLGVIGIKNIEKELKLPFYNKNLSKFTPFKSNVKGIFGPNGIGKTAIIKGIDTLRNIVLKKDTLQGSLENQVIKQLINKKLGYMTITIDFLIIENKKKSKYSHSLTLRLNNDEVSIEEEKIYKKKLTTDEIIKECVIKKGEISNNNFYKNTDELINVTKNLLNDRSLINILGINNKLYIKEFTDIFCFYNKIYTWIDRSYDNHTNYFRKYEKLIDKINDDLLKYDYIVKKEDYSLFKDFINKCKLFLKIFKYNLKDIELDKVEHDGYYYINIFMNYEDYRIKYEFESKGIKILMYLFNYIDVIIKGGIVFIDEIDSNIHDVYLNKIVEFIAMSGEGQLIFTSHNITLLETLKKYKHSIDFINNEQEIVSWKKNGNYNPFRVYKEGYIRGLPFNVNERDFFNIFLGDEQ